MLALVLPAAASAHVERPSYWPNPARDWLYKLYGQAVGFASLVP